MYTVCLVGSPLRVTASRKSMARPSNKDSQTASMRGLSYVLPGLVRFSFSEPIFRRSNYDSKHFCFHQTRSYDITSFRLQYTDRTITHAKYGPYKLCVTTVFLDPTVHKFRFSELHQLYQNSVSEHGRRETKHIV